VQLKDNDFSFNFILFDFRSLFYEFKYLYGKQDALDRAVSKACRFFQVPRLHLNIGSTSKGFAFGPLRLENEWSIIDFDACPMSIIDDMCEFENIYCGADAILVVEKDTVFQHLVNDGFCKELPNVFLATGRGFPDMATRRFLRWLVDICKLPLYVLVDYDPYGLHIYYNYRYGCERTRIESDDLKLDEAIFLGLRYEQFEDAVLDENQLLPLDENDKKRLHLLRTLSLAQNDYVLFEEVELMERLKHKIELEALHSISPTFLLNYYLKSFFGDLAAVI